MLAGSSTGLPGRAAGNGEPIPFCRWIEVNCPVHPGAALYLALYFNLPPPRR